MRGLPPLQAIVLLVALAILGVLGSHYIDMEAGYSAHIPATDDVQEVDSVQAEIELIFSSPPLSYTLKKPSTTGGEDSMLLQSSAPVENPSYGDVNFSSHHQASYWLDVVWKDAAAEGSRHFVQVHISPDYGEEQHFSFSCSSHEMMETFDFQAERSPDE